MQRFIAGLVLLTAAFTSSSSATNVFQTRPSPSSMRDMGETTASGRRSNSSHLGDLGPPNLRLTKSDGDLTVDPGQSVLYALSYANYGEQPATGVALMENVPLHTRFDGIFSTAGWSCTNNGGAGSTCNFLLGTLAAGSSGTLTFALIVDYPLAFDVTHISNTATIADDSTHGQDPIIDDNTASDTTPVTGADLAITKTDGAISSVPGGSLTYTIVASNNGPDAVSNAIVSDILPEFLKCTWSCKGQYGGDCVPEGSGNITSAVSLPVDAFVVYALVCTVAPDAEGNLKNTATIVTPDGVVEREPQNNSATDTNQVIGVDLSISKNDYVTEVPSGGTVTYTIVAANAGPEDALGAIVHDTFASMLACSWTCAGRDGGICTQEGVGSISDAVTLPAHASCTYTIQCIVSRNAKGVLNNTATIAPPANVVDTDASNNSSTDTDAITTRADAAVSMTDVRGFVQVGDEVGYRIDVTNPTGPSTAVVSVNDSLPANLGNGSWVCTTSGGAICTSGTGASLSDVARVPAGGKASYLFLATVLAPGADDRITNTVDVTLNNAVDPTPFNNSTTDIDIVVIFKDGLETPLGNL